MLGDHLKEETLDFTKLLAPQMNFLRLLILLIPLFAILLQNSGELWVVWPYLVSRKTTAFYIVSIIIELLT